MKLIVVMLDTCRTRMAIIHENSFVPYRKRLVQIELTEDQAEKLKPLKVGFESGSDCFEEVGDIWLEND